MRSKGYDYIIVGAGSAGCVREPAFAAREPSRPPVGGGWGRPQWSDSEGVDEEKKRVALGGATYQHGGPSTAGSGSAQKEL